MQQQSLHISVFTDIHLVLTEVLHWPLNQFTSSRFFYNNSLDQSISNSRMSGYFILFIIITLYYHV